MSRAKTKALFIENHLPEPYDHVNLLVRDNNYRLEEHTHPMYQMIWVLQGTLIVKQHGVQHQLNRGHFCMIPPNHAHSLFSESGYTQVGIDLTPTYDSRGIVSLLEKQVTHIAVINRSDRVPIVLEMLESPKHFTLLSRLQIAHMLDSVILSCVELLNDKICFRTRLLDMMKSHLSDNLTLREFAEMLSMSQSTLQRKTNREFGCGVSELYRQLKLNQACSLLLSSDLKISEIAEIVGFNDPAHFSRFFKHKMKKSPLKYKEKYLL